MGIVMLSLAFSNLAGVAISKFMSVPSVNGKINYLESLEIYKEGFLKVGIFNLMLVIVFLFFFNFIHKVVTIVFSKMNDKFPLWYYQPKVVSLYIYALKV